MTVSVILVNYNGADFLPHCLTSITEHTRNVEYEVIIVDNASTDGSKDIVRTQFPIVKMIESKENLGFSRANNLGARHAKGSFFLFLNTDTYLKENSIKILMEYVAARQEVGVIGPKLIFPNGSFQLSAGTLPSLLVEFRDKIRYWFDRMFHRIGSVINNTTLSTTQSVEWVTGACMMVTRKAFEQSGGFDENIFMYFEDKDLCKRISDAGWKIVYHPATTVVHVLGGSSATTMNETLNKHYRDSQLHYYRKHLADIQLFLLRFYLKLSGKV